jgi:hypothetical protein
MNYVGFKNLPDATSKIGGNIGCIHLKTTEYSPKNAVFDQLQKHETVKLKSGECYFSQFLVIIVSYCLSFMSNLFLIVRKCITLINKPAHAVI